MYLDQIAHLDFDFQPDTTKDEITPAQECLVQMIHRHLHFWKHTIPCHNMAAGQITLRCCMATFPCCPLHRSLTIPWLCPKCGTDRGNEWAAWTPL